MMYNIKTGHNEVTRRENDEIAILVTSLRRLRELGIEFVFTNAHAYLNEADYFDDLADLIRVDWDLLRSRNFQRVNLVTPRITGVVHADFEQRATEEFFEPQMHILHEVLLSRGSA